MTGKDERTLLTRLGGEAALKAAVDELYFRLCCDEQLLPFFKGVDMDFLKHHQQRFLGLAFTKIPENVDVADRLTKAHARLFDGGLNETHFDLVAKHLVETLESLGISKDLIDEVLEVVAPLRVIFAKNPTASTDAECKESSPIKKIKRFLANRFSPRKMRSTVQKHPALVGPN